MEQVAEHLPMWNSKSPRGICPICPSHSVSSKAPRAVGPNDVRRGEGPAIHCWRRTYSSLLLLPSFWQAKVLSNFTIKLFHKSLENNYFKDL